MLEASRTKRKGDFSSARHGDEFESEISLGKEIFLRFCERIICTCSMRVENKEIINSCLRRAKTIPENVYG